MNKIIIIHLLVISFFGCNNKISDQLINNQTADSKIKELKKFAAENLKIDISDIEREGGQENFAGFKTPNYLVSGRLDSKTYFFQNNDYGFNKAENIYAGDDGVLMKTCKDLMTSLDIPTNQILKEEVLYEKMQEASTDNNGNIKFFDPKNGKKAAFFTRKINDFPVFSSYCRLELTQERKVGSLEFHWPVISPDILRQAKKLQNAVQGNWECPQIKNAKPEKIEVGIIHSSAAGFLMEKSAVIKVIYAPTEDGIGRKPVMYYNVNGEQIALPRDFKLEPENQKNRSQK